jgi:hypothetical protein
MPVIAWAWYERGRLKPGQEVGKLTERHHLELQLVRPWVLRDEFDDCISFKWSIPHNFINKKLHSQGEGLLASSKDAFRAAASASWRAYSTRKPMGILTFSN